MYALNLGPDGRCLSAAPANLAPIGATLAFYLPEGDLSEYRYVNGEYIHDPQESAEPSADPGEEITTADMAAAIMEGVNSV